MILPISIADHTPVIMELNIKREQWETVWRIKNSLLGDQCFKKKTKRIADVFFFFLEINDKGGVTSTVLWEAAKATIIITHSF